MFVHPLLNLEKSLQITRFTFSLWVCVTMNKYLNSIQLFCLELCVCREYRCRCVCVFERAGVWMKEKENVLCLRLTRATGFVRFSRKDSSDSRCVTAFFPNLLSTNLAVDGPQARDGSRSRFIPVTLRNRNPFAKIASSSYYRTNRYHWCLDRSMQATALQIS